MNEMRNAIAFGLSTRDIGLRLGRRSRDWMRRLEALSSAIGSIKNSVNKYRLLIKLTKQMTYCISLIMQALIVSSLLHLPVSIHFLTIRPRTLKLGTKAFL